MGKLYVTFHKAGALASDKKTIMPVMRLPGAITEVLTTSGVSAKTTAAATNGANPYDPSDGGMVTCKAVGANINVKAGPTASLTAVVPAASPANSPGHPLLSGESITFAVAKNDVIAGIEFT